MTSGHYVTCILPLVLVALYFFPNLQKLFHERAHTWALDILFWANLVVCCLSLKVMFHGLFFVFLPKSLIPFDLASNELMVGSHSSENCMDKTHIECWCVHVSLSMCMCCVCVCARAHSHLPQASVYRLASPVIPLCIPAHKRTLAPPETKEFLVKSSSFKWVFISHYPTSTSDHKCKLAPLNPHPQHQSPTHHVKDSS